jgi:hypothetical protein
MSADARRFAALHLAAYLREHGYEGALDADAEVAILPGADAVGPNNEAILLELARRRIAVARPAPATPTLQHRQEHLVFLGARGQLEPARGRSALRRAVAMIMLGSGLAIRRLRGRPVLWIRRTTLRTRRDGDPAERMLAILLRVFARQTDLASAPNLVDTVGSDPR